MSVTSVLSSLALQKPVPLVYPKDKNGQTLTNVLLIDASVKEYQLLADSVNSTTFPIVYSTLSSQTDLRELLRSTFSPGSRISRIGIVFSSSGGGYINRFLGGKPLFTTEDNIVSENTQFILDVISEFHVAHIDYLACNTLRFPEWVNYYALVARETGVIVGASEDKTGNLKYGGDWVMENTAENVELVYWSQRVEYYQYVLDVPTWWSSGYEGDLGGFTFYEQYMYFPNIGTNTIIQTNLDGTIQNASWATSTQGVTFPECCVVYNGYLYVSNFNNNTISRISLTNPTHDCTASWATILQGLIGPVGIAIQGDYLYVSNFNQNTISRIRLTNPTNDYTAYWATILQELNGPVGIAIQGDYLYVSNFLGNTISRISLTNPTTDYTASWASQGLDGPIGIAIQGEYLYVSNAGNNTISRISLTNPTTDFNVAWAQGLQTPYGIAIYGENLYVYNIDNGTISQIALLNIPTVPNMYVHNITPPPEGPSSHLLPPSQGTLMMAHVV